MVAAATNAQLIREVETQSDRSGADQKSGGQDRAYGQRRQADGQGQSEHVEQADDTQADPSGSGDVRVHRAEQQRAVRRTP